MPFQIRVFLNFSYLNFHILKAINGFATIVADFTWNRVDITDFLL